MSLKVIRCRVRIHRDAGSQAHIDVTERLSPQPHITEIESFGAMATFGIVNNVEIPERNLLHRNCARWSDGFIGPIKTGMFVSFVKQVGVFDSESGEFISEEDTPLSYQLISTIEPTEDIISITSIDALQILRSTGSEYFRDHYTAGGIITNNKTTGQFELGKLIMNKPANLQVLSADWAVQTSAQFSGGGLGKNLVGSINNFIRSEFVPTEETYLGSLTVRLADPNPDQTGGYTGRYSLKVLRGANGETELWSSGVQTPPRSYSDVTFSFGAGPILLLPGESYWIEIRAEENRVSAAIRRYGCSVSTGPKGLSELRRTIYRITSGDQTTTETEFIQCTLVRYAYRIANGVPHDTDSTKWVVNSVQGANIDDSLVNPMFVGRARYSYAGGNAPQTNVNKIFSDIVRAAGFVPDTSLSAGTGINIFRCAGDMYHNYLLMLSEMKDDVAGRRRVISASAENWGIIRMGLRHQRDDPDSMAVALFYAGDYDGNISSGPNVSYRKQVMRSFSPKITRRHRPSTSMVVSAMNETDQPILVALKDPHVTYGESILSGSQSASDYLNAAFTAYRDIMTNRSTDWEGTVELSGIHTEYLGDGQYLGSGISVRIFDSRYDMDGYRARVRQVDYNFRDLTTTLLINNNNVGAREYNINTEKMAYVAGNVSLAAATPEQLNRQFLHVTLTSAQAPLTSNNIVRIWFGDASSGTPSSNAVPRITIDELNSTLLIGYFEVGTGNSTTLEHGVKYVSVNGGPKVEIPEYLRPDKYAYQSLTVCIQVV